MKVRPPPRPHPRQKKPPDQNRLVALSLKPRRHWRGNRQNSNFTPNRYSHRSPIPRRRRLKCRPVCMARPQVKRRPHHTVVFPLAAQRHRKKRQARKPRPQPLCAVRKLVKLPRVQPVLQKQRAVQPVARQKLPPKLAPPYPRHGQKPVVLAERMEARLKQRVPKPLPNRQRRAYAGTEIAYAGRSAIAVEEGSSLAMPH